MIAAASFSALGLVVLVALWSRFAPGRAQRQSVRSHQRALDVLGELAKRQDGAAAVHVPGPDEVGRAHVHTTDGAPPSFHLASREEIGSRKPTAPLVLRSGPTPLKLPIFGNPNTAEVEPTVRFDDDLTGAATEGRLSVEDVSVNSTLASSPPTADAPERAFAHALPYARLFAPEPETVDSSPALDGSPASVSEDAEHSPVLAKGHRLPLGVGQGARKGASIAAAIVALAAIGVGTWQITSSNSPSPRALKPPTVTQPSKPSSSIPRSSNGHVTSHEIAPVSQTGNLITYPLTSQSFTIKFISSGACWIGVRQGLNGTYLWMTTLGAGGSATYQANGPVYVRIGAPKYAHVQINGVALALPPHVVTPYDITFSIGGSVSA